MYSPMQFDPGSDFLARKRFLERISRHDNTHRGCPAHRMTEHALSTKGQKRTRACFRVTVEDDDPWKPGSRVPPTRRVYLRYLEQRYRSESRPLGHHDHCPVGCRAALEGWLSCIRNQAQSVESTHEPMSAAKRGECPETRHGAESVFVVFATAYGTPESPAAT